MITSEEIKSRLWAGANELRGSMDASRYKDYMLGLMFYKFLSDKTLDAFKTSSGSQAASEEELVNEYKAARESYGDMLDQTLQNILGYYVTPDYLYQTWLIDINNGEFELQKVTDSLNNFERSIAIGNGSDDFKGLFSSSTIDLTNTALGSNLNERSKNVQALILLFADLNMVALQEADVLGDAYEYLIGQFAMESGQKAGEFYTPQQVSEVMAQIVAKSSNIQSIYDPTVGSGSLLLTVGKHLTEDERINLNYYGQERNTATYNLTRMNLLLHGVRPEKMSIRNGDTLAEDWPEDPERPNEGVQFDAVVMNPPYSLKNWNRNDLKISDPRFEVAGILPPASKGDFAFLLHGLYHLNTEGTMAIVLPHGVLFRGGAEGEIRQRLIDKNYIDTIIGLPSSLFTNTGIPVTVLILKKNRSLSEPILMIDASEDFIKVGKQNVLQEKHIAKIVDTYVNRNEVEGYSALATKELIVENEYNMNIPRYVVADNEEIDHDVDAHLYGGIPEENIKDLTLLNTMTKDVLDKNFDRIRPGYYKLESPIETLTDEVLAHDNIQKEIISMQEKMTAYIGKYWTEIRNANEDTNHNELMDQMLKEIKELLTDFPFINAYNGYQEIAELWNTALRKDLEIVSLLGYYEAARKLEPNIITKGTGKNKREVQEGWISSLLSNDLIIEHLLADEAEQIVDLESTLVEITSELDELIEAAKIEGTEENEALYDGLSKNREGEPGNSFTKTAVNSELRNAEKGTLDYDLLKKVVQLLDDRTKHNRLIREGKAALKEKVEALIPNLTETEIDQLTYNKWFADLEINMKNLIEQPLKEELDQLKMLNDRYNNTLSDLEEKYETLETKFQSLLDELVSL